jgi:DNA modification methylase
MISDVKKRIYFHSCENMGEVENDSAKLVIISPPLTNNPDSISLDKSNFLLFLRNVFTEISRIITPDGILVSVNTDLRDHSYYNKGHSGFDGTVWFKHCDIRSMAESADFKCLDCKIWAKSLNINVYRYNFAYIMFFCKNKYKPIRPGLAKGNPVFKSDIWLLNCGTQRVDSNGYRFRNAIHPKIVELCIEEFSSPGDLIVSPFAGSGTILAIAEIMGRKWVGYEIDETLKPLIEESIYGPVRPRIYTDIMNKYTNNG